MVFQYGGASVYGFVYLTTNLINGKKYIGMCKTTHRKNYLGSGKLLKHAIKKYGKDSFVRETLEECNSFEELSFAEKKWIAKYNADMDPNFYNIVEGGFGGCSEHMKKFWTKLSLEERKKARKWGKPWKGIGRPKTAEERKKLSIITQNYWNQFSDEEKKIARNWKGGSGPRSKNPRSKAGTLIHKNGKIEFFTCLKEVCDKYPQWNYFTLRNLCQRQTRNITKQNFNNLYGIIIKYDTA